MIIGVYIPIWILREKTNHCVSPTRAGDIFMTERKNEDIMEQNFVETSAKNEYTYVATCLFGLEKFVGEEIDACGGKRLSTIDGRVVFSGDEELLARVNLNLRTAERRGNTLSASATRFPSKDMRSNRRSIRFPIARASSRKP